MAERLVVISDMWGAKRGLWITSYLGYLQQYFDIVYYDSLQLANIELAVNSDENITRAFAEGGMQTAMAHILKRESVKSHYLTFCAGGAIAWKASLNGLPMKSLYAISPQGLHLEEEAPACPVKVLYGANQRNIPDQDWAKSVGVSYEVVPNFGRQLYTDEKIISKVCLEVLNSLLKKQYQV